jgi:hypothetical protein
MIEVKYYGNVETKFLGIFDGALGHIAEHGLVGVLAGSGGNLEDDGAFRLDASLDDCLELFHVVEVVGGDGEPAPDCFLEDFYRIDQSELFVTRHSALLHQAMRNPFPNSRKWSGQSQGTGMTRVTTECGIKEASAIPDCPDFARPLV